MPPNGKVVINLSTGDGSQVDARGCGGGKA
jgi:hypothetical protein